MEYFTFKEKLDGDKKKSRCERIGIQNIGNYGD